MPNSKRKAHCNKRPFKTLLKAQISMQRTIKNCKKRGDPIVTGLNVYKCPYCPSFHIGRSAKKGINWTLVAAVDAKLKATAVRTMDSTPGFYPEDVGSIPARQAKKGKYANK